MQTAVSRLAAETNAHARTLIALDAVVAEAGGFLTPATVRDLKAGRARLAEARFNLVVLGEFKRGKSTLINSLLGRDVLPTGVVPVTSAVTTLRCGRHERLVVGFVDGRQEEHPLSELARFATERENPGNELGVTTTEVELSAGPLPAGLQLVDTPGIGSIHRHNTELAHEFLPRVDAAICVLTADQPLGDAERDFFAQVAGRTPRLLFVINKIDHLDRDERVQAVAFVNEATASLLGPGEAECFAVSARTGDGVARLADRIAQLAEQEGDALLVRSVAALACRAAADSAQAVRFEGRAVELSFEELSRRSTLFAARARMLQSARDEAADLLDRGVERLLADRVNEPLKGFASRAENSLRAELAAHIEQLDGLSARELAPALDGWVDATIRRRFDELGPALEETVGQEVGNLQRRFAQRIGKILTEVQEAAAEAFGLRGADQLPDLRFAEPSRFSFKLADPSQMLDQVISFGRRTVPGTLGRRLVVRDARERHVHMADRHAGRLRSALVERVRAAVTIYERDLTAAVDQAVAAIEASLSRAAQEQRQGEAEVGRRRAELDLLNGRLTSLALELSALAESPKGPSHVASST